MDEEISEFLSWAKQERLALDTIIIKIEERTPLTAEEIEDMKRFHAVYENGVSVLN